MNSLSADDLIDKIRNEALRIDGADPALPARSRSAAGKRGTIPNLQTAHGEPVPASFADRKDYDAAEILAFPDLMFVRAAYLAALGRDADESGLRHHTDALRGGDLTKRQFLQSLLATDEAKQKGATVAGLDEPPERFARFHALPMIGRVIRSLATFMRLPRMVHEQKLLTAIVEAAQVRNWQADQMLRTDFSALKSSVGADISHVLTETTRLLRDVASLHTRCDSDDAHRSHADRQADSIQALSNRLDSLTTQLSGFGAAIHGVKQAVARQQNELHAATRPLPSSGVTLKDADERNPPSAYDALYASFQDRFRGSSEKVAGRQRKYLPYLARAVLETGTDQVLDLGTGRGEWLTAVRDAGYRGCGIDRNHVMSLRCTKAGLTVRHTDVMDGLRTLPDAHFAFVSAFHLIEHVPSDVLIGLLDEIRRVLRPGGIVLLETPNARNLRVGSADFYRDPTHRNPVHPETLHWLGEARGFVEGAIFYVNGEALDMVPAESWKFRQLADHMAIPPDYVWIAHKPQNG